MSQAPGPGVEPLRPDGVSVIRVTLVLLPTNRGQRGASGGTQAVGHCLRAPARPRLRAELGGGVEDLATRAADLR